MRITVKGTRTPSGPGYQMVGLFVDGGLVRTLLPSDCRLYAAAVTAMAQRAEMVTAIKAQMTDPDTGVGYLAAGEIIYDFLAEVPPPGNEVRPLSYTLASDVATIGMVGVRHHERSGLWTPVQCRAHALDVLRVSANIELEATYRRVLAGHMGLGPDRAALIVSDLRNYQPRASDG